MCLSFTPKFGEMIQFDEHIFQLGWFNRQLENYALNKRGCCLIKIFDLFCWMIFLRIVPW